MAIDSEWKGGTETRVQGWCDTRSGKGGAFTRVCDGQEKGIKGKGIGNLRYTSDDRGPEHEIKSALDWNRPSARASSTVLRGVDSGPRNESRPIDDRTEEGVVAGVRSAGKGGGMDGERPRRRLRRWRIGREA